MKKRGKPCILLVGLLVLMLALPPGCATLTDLFCSPTADEIANATMALGNANDLSTFLGTLPASPETAAVLAAINLALPVLNDVRNNICVSAEKLKAALEVVTNNEKVMLKSMPAYKGFKAMKGK